MGAFIFGAGRLMRANTVITIQASTVTKAGAAPVESFTTLAANIAVLMTTHSGGRVKNFNTDNERTDVIVRGVDARMGRPDVRFLIVSSESLGEVSGWYLRVDSAQEHPAGLGGLQVATVQCRCTAIQLPATFGTSAKLGA